MKKNIDFGKQDDSILITGGTGLLGTELKFGKRIGSADVDLTDTEQVMDYFSDHKPEKVIHCAGLVGGVKTNTERMGDFFTQNMKMNMNVIEACKEFGVKKLIGFLSTCVFPDEVAQKGVLTENDIMNGVPHSSNYGYAYAKRMMYVNAMAYKQQYGLDYNMIIPCNLYGSNDNYNLNDSHLVPALIKKCYLAKLNNTEFQVWGDGKPLRQFMYAEDLAYIIYQIVSKNMDIPSLMIVAPEEECSVKEIVEHIASIFDYDMKGVYYNTDMPKGQFKKTSKNDVFRKYFKRFQFTDIHDGLSETIEYFQKNLIHLRS